MITELDDVDFYDLWKKIEKTFHGYWASFRSSFLVTQFNISDEIADEIINIWEELGLIEFVHDNGFAYYKVIKSDNRVPEKLH